MAVSRVHGHLVMELAVSDAVVADLLHVFPSIVEEHREERHQSCEGEGAHPAVSPVCHPSQHEGDGTEHLHASHGRDEDEAAQERPREPARRHGGVEPPRHRPVLLLAKRLAHQHRRDHAEGCRRRQEEQEGCRQRPDFRHVDLPCQEDGDDVPGDGHGQDPARRHPEQPAHHRVDGMPVGQSSPVVVADAACQQDHPNHRRPHRVGRAEIGREYPCRHHLHGHRHGIREEYQHQRACVVRLPHVV